MFTEKGTFPDGIIVDGKLCRDFELAEETFRHTLEIANDPGIDKELCNDLAYYQAALFSKRLTVEGIEKMTPEMVSNLSGIDGRTLLDVNSALEIRREEFRKQGKGSADEHPGDDKAGVQPGAGGSDAEDGSAGDPEGARRTDGNGGAGAEVGAAAEQPGDHAGA